MDKSVDSFGGWLLGLSLGDAFGAPFEFNRKIEFTGKLEYKAGIPSRFQGYRSMVPGQITDDTEMTMVLANRLIQDKTYDSTKVTQDYLKWANQTSTLGKNTRALFKGVTTVNGYRNRFNKQFPDMKARQAAQSNGALMRCGPLVVLRNSKAVIEDCMLTNPSDVAADTNLAYIAALEAAIGGKDTLNIVNAAYSTAQNPDTKQAIKDGFDRTPRVLTEKRSKGWCCNALYVAILGISHANSFMDLMGWIMSNKGSDSDTLASIAGGLYGARAGYSKLLGEAGVDEAANVMFSVDTTKGDYPRAQEYLLTRERFRYIVFGLAQLWTLGTQSINPLGAQFTTTSTNQSINPSGIQSTTTSNQSNIQPTTITVVGSGTDDPEKIKLAEQKVYHTITKELQLDPKNVILLAKSGEGYDRVPVKLFIDYPGVFGGLVIPSTHTITQDIKTAQSIGAQINPKLSLENSNILIFIGDNSVSSLWSDHKGKKINLPMLI